MIDIEKLKALAEAAKEDWCNWWTLQQLENRAVDGAGAELIVAANPAAVLELIAEIERYRYALRRVFKSTDGAFMVDGKWMVNGPVMDMVERTLYTSAESSFPSEEKDAELDQLKAENEALRKDAERYRWLRDSSESIHQFYLSTPIWFTGLKFSKDNVDSTIDAAMSKVQP